MPEKTLKDQRIKFTRLFLLLIAWGNVQPGYQIAIGRDFDEAHEELHHKKGSLHYMGLANDLALYVQGEYQRDTAAYTVLGEYWESLDPDCKWGGRWNDGNHFSVKWEGKA